MYLHKIVLIWRPLKRIIGGRENQNAYLEYDTSNENYAFNKANSYLFKNGQNGYVGGAGEFFRYHCMRMK